MPFSKFKQNTNHPLFITLWEEILAEKKLAGMAEFNSADDQNKAKTSEFGPNSQKYLPQINQNIAHSQKSIPQNNGEEEDY